MNIQAELESFIHNFQRFLRWKDRNLWVRSEHEIIQAYCRKAHHSINGKMTETLDIANISVEAEYQNQGLGMGAIDAMDQLNPFKVTYVENVLNDQLACRLRLRGWTEIHREDEQLSSFYLVKS